ncbi:FAD-dependent oxidoreductase [Saccharobesus litoralis]|uniref:FAD-dependent oxidoreductase n=1 Tax=Saccharobesus litoralis TaxID=2172099 RepID=A0A2S0VMK2_9ALTE|nr:FAD-dependent oxidoreductase [Saccharobesus litoralis]AWB65409.1 FAD-dependent oxidoreductase [Saccharobesus litoralis]
MLDNTQAQQEKPLDIAIIGSGISGLTTAYLLNQKHNVTVFEKNDYIGGHTATVDVEVDNKPYAIDTGFIVFNNKTYPNFLKLLAQIGVPRQETEMSFSVQNLDSGLEYNGHNLDTLFAQRSNLFNPKFYGLINDILRFNKKCKQLYAAGNIDSNLTLDDFLKQNHFSDYFAQHYILPMGAAIWSSSLDEMAQFQLKFFIQFFHHHGLLNVNDRPQWYVIPGGSRSYIAPLTKRFADNIKLNSHISRIERQSPTDPNTNIKGKPVTLFFADGSQQAFDKVVFACHSNQALALLGENASQAEQSVLADLPYSKNQVVLHTDINLLPKRQKAWASWNYQLNGDRQRPASVTYNMNILQGLAQQPQDPVFCVTLNQTQAIAPSKILRQFEYWHPVFNCTSLAAQARRHEINGLNHSYFVGAYWYNGFHEDGVKSAVDVGDMLGCPLE